MTREEAKLIGVTTVPSRGLKYVWYENYINKIDKIYDYFKLELEAEYKRGQDSMLSRTCESCKYNREQDGFMIFCDCAMCLDGSKMMWHSYTKDFGCNKYESNSAV